MPFRSDSGKRRAFRFRQEEHLPSTDDAATGQTCAGEAGWPQAEGVMFQAAVTDATGHIVKQASERPPRYLEASVTEVPAEGIHADK